MLFIKLFSESYQTWYSGYMPQVSSLAQLIFKSEDIVCDGQSVGKKSIVVSIPYCLIAANLGTVVAPRQK